MIRVEWTVDHFGLRLLDESYSNYTISYILPYQRELAYNLRKRNRNRLLNVKQGHYLQLHQRLVALYLFVLVHSFLHLVAFCQLCQ